MDRGGGQFTPRGRFWRRGGGSRSFPSSSGYTDPPAHTPGGAELSSCDRISGDTPSTVDGSGERSWHSDERFSGGRQRSGQIQPGAYKAGNTRSPVGDSGERSWHRDERFSGGRKGLGQSQQEWKQVQPVVYKASDTSSPVDGSGERSWNRDERSSGGRQRLRQSQPGWKQVQPVAFKASAGQGSPLSNSRDKTDCGVGFKESNYQAEIVDESYQRNVRPSSQKSRQWYKDSKKAQPVSNEASSAHSCPRYTDGTDWEVTSLELNYRVEIVGSDSIQSDLSFDSTVGVLKPTVPENVSGDEPLDLDQSHMKNLGSQGEKSSVSVKYSPHNSLSCPKDPDSVGSSENSEDRDSSQHFKCQTDAKQFDICPPKAGGHIVLNQSLLEMNKEKRKQIKHAQEPKGTLIRSGMFLLKNFISISEQVNIVKECRKLGLGTGGFYQPGYRDGAKLNLNMMCLGKNWDPETRRYEEIRPTDGAKPPLIPISFLALVKKSLEESLALIAEECKSTGSAKDILPWMSPDICIVNFYSTSGRLGLHQDRDESEESLRRGLPVVSISIGDSAEFLYGDQRDVDKAEKVTLESGDVLIFGGDSRHVFHGVSSIQPTTAPKPLLKETNLRPGRLNLTFRQY